MKEKHCGFCLQDIKLHGNGDDMTTFDGKSGLVYHHNCVIKYLKTQQ